MVALAIGFAVVGSLLLVWMLVLTRRAWRTLPPGAQVPVHGGLGGWDKWRPKESALLVWPVVGGLIWLAEAGTAILLAADAAPRSNGGLAALPVTLTLPMIILLVTEHYALKAARATGGAGGVGGTPA
jgi:hypothetical protein